MGELGADEIVVVVVAVGVLFVHLFSECGGP